MTEVTCGQNARILQMMVERYVRTVEATIREEMEKEGGEKEKNCGECVRKLLNRIAGDLCSMIVQVTVDPLTGAFTRVVLDAFLDRELEISRRHDLPLSLLFVDVDNLKQINDNFGHEAGDVVIETVADVLRRSIRRADALFRYGGDEFLILLRATEKGAEKVKERILQNLFLKEVFCSGRKIPLSISAGVVEVREFSRSGFEEALSVADERMYEEKRAKKKVKVL